MHPDGTSERQCRQDLSRIKKKITQKKCQKVTSSERQCRKTFLGCRHKKNGDKKKSSEDAGPANGNAVKLYHTQTDTLSLFSVGLFCHRNSSLSSLTQPSGTLIPIGLFCHRSRSLLALPQPSCMRLRLS